MKVILSENQFHRYLLSEIADTVVKQNDDYNPVADGNATRNPYKKQNEANIKQLVSFLSNNGKMMTNINNGKDYYVYEIMALANLIGKRYGFCQLIKDNKPFGAIYIKPLSLFRLKTR